VATFANFVAVPVQLDVALSNTNLINAAAVFRRPATVPLVVDGGSGGGSGPRGPQIWPR
jgi:hypothetical protein